MTRWVVAAMRQVVKASKRQRQAADEGEYKGHTEKPHRVVIGRIQVRLVDAAQAGHVVFQAAQRPHLA